MSLVDYASSSGEEEDEAEEHAGGVDRVEPGAKEDKGREKEGEVATASCTLTSLPRSSSSSQDQQNRTGKIITNVQPASITSQPAPVIELPDASLLFASPSFSSQKVSIHDHSSRVAAAKTFNAAKRNSNCLATHVPQNKKPLVDFPHSRDAVAQTTGLVPPQLLGRSNVVTEDVSKLFVNRHRGASQ